MKVVSRILAVIGGLSIFVLGFGLASSYIMPSYTEMAREDFGTAEAKRNLVQLYAQVKLNVSDLEIVESHISPKPIGSSIKRVPASWVKGFYGTTWGSGMWGSVFAHFDADNKLLAIEFYGSRYGCLVSERPTICPVRFVSLVRLHNGPVFVTARITGRARLIYQANKTQHHKSDRAGGSEA